MPDKSTSGPRLRCEINVAPLVDVILVLLIIFMVVTPLLQRGFDLAVPPVVEGPPPSDLHDQIVVTLTPSGACFVNSVRASCGDLAGTLASMLSGHQRLVFLSAARGLSYGGVVETMDAIRLAGAGRIGLVTDDAVAEQLENAGQLQ